jgi:hypothetical protein
VRDLDRRRRRRIGRGQWGRGCAVIGHAGRSLGYCGG